MSMYMVVLIIVEPSENVAVAFVWEVRSSGRSSKLKKNVTVPGMLWTTWVGINTTEVRYSLVTVARYVFTTPESLDHV